MRTLARALALALGLGACMTPSLPLPPPDPGLVTFSLDTAAEQATFQAGADPDWPGARVEVFDQDTGRGVITTANADGSVDETEPFRAHEGDHVYVVYEDDVQSASLCLILRDGASSFADICP
jgi:hypothetical protein